MCTVNVLVVQKAYLRGEGHSHVGTGERPHLLNKHFFPCLCLLVLFFGQVIIHNKSDHQSFRGLVVIS